LVASYLFGVRVSFSVARLLIILDIGLVLVAINQPHNSEIAHNGPSPTKFLPSIPLRDVISVEHMHLGTYWDDMACFIHASKDP